MTAATLQMNTPQWISHREYNTLLDVEEARKQISVKDQIEITKELSEYILTNLFRRRKDPNQLDSTGRRTYPNGGD